MTFLEVAGIGRRLGARFALQGVSFEVEPGGIFGVVGPSGAGKTTLLRLIAGLEEPHEGEIRLAGESISRPGRVVAPERRGVGLVFQSLGLWGHLTAFEHLDLALRARMGRRKERAAEAAALLELARMAGLEDAKPGELSGGERQRLALARAIAARPRLLLLDEPFAHVDAPLRDDLACDLLAFLRAAGVAALLVSHDGAHVAELCPRLAVMERGRVIQTGEAREIYDHPAAPVCARMTGPAFLLEGHGEGGSARTAIGTVALNGSGAAGEGIACLRPESFALYAVDGAPASAQPASIERAAFTMGRWKTHFRLNGAAFWTWDDRHRAPESGARVSLAPAAWIAGTAARG